MPILDTKRISHEHLGRHVSYQIQISKHKISGHRVTTTLRNLSLKMTKMTQEGKKSKSLKTISDMIDTLKVCFSK